MHYIKSGIMGKKFSKLYNAGLEIREDSDYEEFYVIDKTAADNNFILVREFINYAGTFISKAESSEV
mgnify:CR=1 FL=1